MQTPVSQTGLTISPPTAQRLILVAGIALLEILLTSILFEFPPSVPYWQNPVIYANMIAQLALLSLIVFGMVAWPRRQEIAQAFNAAAGDHGWKFCLALNALFFAALILARYRFSTVPDSVSYGSLAAYSGLLALTGLSLVALAAPTRFWRQLAKLAPAEIAIAIFGAGFAFGASALAQEGWDYLSSATLALAHWFLSLYEPTVFLDTETRTLGAGDFRVEVHAPCSGYEGAGLIAAFLAIYLWVFRRELRFPNAFLLFPIGITAIWVLNALRIALLVSIGAHASPTVAVNGFHSQGGWIAFLIVTLTCIAASRRVAFFAARPVQGPVSGAVVQQGQGARITLEYLAPFMALMAASVVASAFVPHDQWLYALKVAATGAVLWWFRDAYLPLVTGASPVSVVTGLAVGAAWIATDPGRGADAPLGMWLATLPAGLAVLWLALRALGSVVLVPVAEELAFRGYLHRALISARFEAVSFGAFRPLAFLGSSIAFGMMHQRWLAACLAGAVYALLMYRSKRLADPIVAHIASNAAIMAWAVALQQWSLL